MRIVFPTAAAALLLAASAQGATTYPGMQSTIKYSKSSTAASGFGNYARATSSVVYDPATDTYTLRDTGNLSLTASFGPANIDSGASDATFTVYKKTLPGSTETFRLLNQSPTNPLIVLSYVDYGQWRRATLVTGGTTNINDTYVVFGSKTPGASVPLSGTATYSTVLDGTFVNTTGNYAVSGTGGLTANFGAGTIAYNATASATPETTGVAFSFGTMTGAGMIAFRSAGFSGTGTTNGSGYSMDVWGNFYGPAVDEVGGLFRIRGNGGTGEGAIVGN
jgi:hypothetical protein